MPFCKECGAKDAGRFCGDCGAAQDGVAPRGDVDLNETRAAFDKVGAATSGPRREVDLWSGTTWGCCCLSAIFCSATHWKITTKRIDWESGYCKAHSDTIDFRRVKDISYRRNPGQFVLGRGTITIYADAAANDNHITFSKFGARKIYYKIRKAWTAARIGLDEGSTS